MLSARAETSPIPAAEIEMKQTRPWLVTRPAPQAQHTAAVLRAHGIAALAEPLISIEPLSPPAKALLQLDQYEGIIAVSANAVDIAAGWLKQQGCQWPPRRYYAIGAATRAAFARHHGFEIRCARPATTEGLLSDPGLQSLPGQKWGILRGRGGRETLAEALRQRGAQIDYIELYERRPIPCPGSSSREMIARWQQQDVIGVIITSGEILAHLCRLLPPTEYTWSRQLLLIVPSRRIADQARLQGFNHILVADGASDQALLDTILLHREKGL